MVISILGWVARRRLAVLTAALLTAVALQVVLHVTGTVFAPWASFAVYALPPAALLLCMAVAIRVHDAAHLVARPEIPAFGSPPNPTLVLGAACLTYLAVYGAAGGIRSIEPHPDLGHTIVSIALYLTELAVFWWASRLRTGISIRPDGILDRQPFGDLFIPWDALATPIAAQPHDAHRVTLHLAHPDLTRRRGLRRGAPAALSAAGVRTDLLAWMINHYADQPADRSAIGSPAALTRFLLPLDRLATPEVARQP
ncbi:hypothetical protein ACWT_3802 [Actinoplanes sp. SE50]|uniref:hypothetical protein n=1 Tax=unclassified Actinoplanes TaxID=2626549 RepID=UPI00023ECCC1|nr:MULTISPECIES: hypothetical protein [unclassified Actinoplanes]AEV84825.1 hypothetical protein ACPL_3930 [Actinoplanes sp. SE50/110]ATO83217.1 hypothetical protein ACWT_3802 [Actinoplanes sp. SE50]SLM00624.1 hypothetical protein ACSP50_3857 [Actinoplanes sp. SE50/110]